MNIMKIMKIMNIVEYVKMDEIYPHSGTENDNTIIDKNTDLTQLLASQDGLTTIGYKSNIKEVEYTRHDVDN